MNGTRGRRGAARAAPLILLAAATLATPADAQRRAPDQGPGALFIVGGGRQPAPLLHRFIELAGGPDRARIAVIPLASAEPAESGRGKVDHLAEYGGTGFVLMTTAAEAHDPAVLAALDSATAVWFTGGVQSRITDALAGTPLLERLRERHAAGLPMGGTSAGAAIMSPRMITGDQYDAEGDSIGYFGDEFPVIARGRIHTIPGLGFLPAVIVDQHFVRRERHNRLMSVVLEHPDHIGVGIDESTALEVRPDGSWLIHGESVAVVYDARTATVRPAGGSPLGAVGLTVHILPSGSRYDPGTGRAVLP